MRKRRFHEIDSTEKVAAYTANLNNNWPIRQQVVQHIVQQVSDLAFSPPHVLELCSGAGLLAEQLLRALPAVEYTGIDFLQAMVDATQARLAGFGAHATLFQADLNKDEWLAQLALQGGQGKFHAIISMQSLHDLGGEPEVGRIYQLARSLLLPGGLFLNADLIVIPGEELPDNPGRLTISRHLALLQAQGYKHIKHTFDSGGFGCVIGFH